MRRLIPARLTRLSVVTVSLLLSLGTLTSLAAATPSAAAKKYWPSISVSPQTGLKSGQTVKVTGKGFAPNMKVTLNECNQGLLNAPHGVINSTTCDLTHSVTTTSTSTGTIATTFRALNEQTGGLADDWISGHGSILGQEVWGWISWEFTKAPFLSSNPTELWLNPQTVKVTGLHIPIPATGSSDVVAECNPNVLSGDTAACGTPAAVTVSSTGKSTGKLSEVTGTVGDGTCGTGSADEVCYLVLANVPSGGTPTGVAIEAIDFYEGQ